MNREEAINVIKGARKYLTVGNPIWNVKKVDEAFDMAIEALQTEYEDYEHATLVDIKEPLKVAVVRCKDCRWQEECSQFVVLHKFCGVYQEISFCSHGERKQDD